MRSAKAINQTRLLLNCSLVGNISIISPSHESFWATILPSEEGSERYDSRYLQEGYFVEGMVGVQDQFTDPAALPVLPFVKPETYYAAWGIGPDARMELPESLPELLDRFRALQPDQHDQYIRACYWLDHAYQVHSRSRSASFMALINAVEALNPIQPGGPRCDCCENCTFEKDGPTKRFRDFLEKHGPSNLDNSMLSELYKMRSDLSHGNYLLISDQDMLWGLSPRDNKQRDAANTAWIGVRMALLNWLLAQPHRERSPSI